MSESVSSISHATGATTLISLDTTLGAILIGALISMALWGVICTQTYDYFMDNTDGRLQRWIVALLWIVDTFSSAMNSHMVYHYSIKNYSIKALRTPTWTMSGHSVVVGVSNFIIRMMFARRIYQFGQKNTIIPAWILTTSICDLVVAILMAVESLTPGMRKNITKLLYISFALGVTADLSVTVALCWLLQSAKSGIRRSDSLVNVLMAYMVNTGLLVTIVVTMGMVTYIVMPDNQVFFAFFIVLSQLYLNAYLAGLNMRGRLRGKDSDSSIPLSGLDVSSSPRKDTQGIVLSANERVSHFHNPALAIPVQTRVERRVDVDNEVKNPPHVV